MEINSVVKRNNPVWNKQTTQVNFTIPTQLLGGMSIVTGENPATYIMITNTSAAFVDVVNTSVSGTRGIVLAPGATFETAIDLGPPETFAGAVVYGIGVSTLVPAGGEVITVTYFIN